MGTLRLAAAAIALHLAVPAHAGEIGRWQPLLAEASARFGVPVSWIARVLAAESAGRTTLHGRPITSPAGAMGLMQLMPGTWADMRARLSLGADPHDPRDNILAGTAYLRLMYERFGYPGLFAAYNAGPARYAAYRAGKRALPAETRAYLAMTVGAEAEAFRPAGPPGHRGSAIFFAGGTGGATASVRTIPVQRGPANIFIGLGRQAHSVEE